MRRLALLLCCAASVLTAMMFCVPLPSPVSAISVRDDAATLGAAYGIINEVRARQTEQARNALATSAAQQAQTRAAVAESTRLAQVTREALVIQATQQAISALATQLANNLNATINASTAQANATTAAQAVQATQTREQANIYTTQLAAQSLSTRLAADATGTAQAVQAVGTIHAVALQATAESYAQVVEQERVRAAMFFVSFIVAAAVVTLFTLVLFIIWENRRKQEVHAAQMARLAVRAPAQVIDGKAIPVARSDETDVPVEVQFEERTTRVWTRNVKILPE